MSTCGQWVKGLQHVGLPTNDLKKTRAFYESLGFEEIYATRNEQAGEDVSFLRLGDLTLEVYENGRAEMRLGAIDHLALDVTDVDAVYAQVQKLGYLVVSDGIEFLHFWKNGVRFFTILGPNRERIEFNQYL